VRKHIEHILRRLEVPARTAAAVCYLAGSGVPTSHRRLTDVIDRYLPDVFEGDPRPGPFDTSAAG
jgi:hypothetical protein